MIGQGEKIESKERLGQGQGKERQMCEDLGVIFLVMVMKTKAELFDCVLYLPRECLELMA